MKFSLSRKSVEESGSPKLLALVDKRDDQVELELPDEEDLKRNFSSEYSTDGLTTKLKKYARSIGREGVKNALLLYYALQSKELSARHKTVIIGCLGYLISVIDVVPDFTPLLGYTDDFALLAAAVTALVSAIDDETKERAEQQTRRIFGEDK